MSDSHRVAGENRPLPDIDPVLQALADQPNSLNIDVLSLPFSLLREGRPQSPTTTLRQQGGAESKASQVFPATTSYAGKSMLTFESTFFSSWLRSVPSIFNIPARATSAGICTSNVHSPHLQRLPTIPVPDQPALVGHNQSHFDFTTASLRAREHNTESGPANSPRDSKNPSSHTRASSSSLLCSLANHVLDTTLTSYQAGKVGSARRWQVPPHPVEKPSHTPEDVQVHLQSLPQTQARGRGGRHLTLSTPATTSVALVFKQRTISIAVALSGSARSTGENAYWEVLPNSHPAARHELLPNSLTYLWNTLFFQRGLPFARSTHMGIFEETLSVRATWWGYRLYIPLPLKVDLSSISIYTKRHDPNVGFNVLLSVSYSSCGVRWGSDCGDLGMVESHSQGYGVIPTATRLTPAALVPMRGFRKKGCFARSTNMRPGLEPKAQDCWTAWLFRLMLEKS
ncbi:hypothetical protein BDQ17DRAFT_1436210 [Cyathus striatus]|nr:hypothetical protein BDQ17DRAFT_1436210 [Cyathus striatus]